MVNKTKNLIQSKISIFLTLKFIYFSKYWSKMLMPQGITQGLWSVCPFCAVPLCKEQPCVKLIFQEGL